jgi:hypothetical protein
MWNDTEREGVHAGREHGRHGRKRPLAAARKYQRQVNDKPMMLATQGCSFRTCSHE